MAAKWQPQLPVMFTYGQAKKAGVSKHEFYLRRDSGEIQPVGRGLYLRANADVANLDLIEFATRAGDATLCLTSALSRHGLTDVISTVTDLALPRGSRAPITMSPAQWHFFDADTFELGRGLLSATVNLQIGLYSAERSIIDAFRMRGREGSELAHEALKRWLRMPGAQPSSLLRLANRFPRSVKTIRTALEVLL